MKNLKTNHQTELLDALKKFRMLLLGSKMSIGATIILIGISIVLMFYSRENLTAIVSLSIGIIALIVYIFNFLWLKDIVLNSDSSTAFPSNIAKFKTYMAKRKNNETIYMSVWMLSTIPAVTLFLESQTEAFAIVALAIVLMAVGGYFSFKKVDSHIESLEALTVE